MRRYVLGDADSRSHWRIDGKELLNAKRLGLAVRTGERDRITGLVEANSCPRYMAGISMKTTTVNSGVKPVG